MTCVFILCKCFGCTLSWWWITLFVALDILKDLPEVMRKYN